MVGGGAQVPCRPSQTIYGLCVIPGWDFGPWKPPMLTTSPQKRKLILRSRNMVKPNLSVNDLVCV